MKMILAKQNFLCLMLLVIAFGYLPSLASAQIDTGEGPGCCKHKNSSGYGETYENTTRDKCKGVYDSFSPDAHVAANGLSCEPNAASDTDNTPLKIEPSKITPPTLAVSIPGFGKFSEVTCASKDECQIPWISEYILAIYNYGMLALGMISVIMLMIGGIMYVTAAGNRENISRANGYIRSSIAGLALAFCSYLILYIVNPKLTTYRGLPLQYIDQEALEGLEGPDTVSDALDAPKTNKKYPYVSKKNCQANPCDDCVATSLPVKHNNQVNKSLNAKLLKVRSSVGWQITEGYPCTQKHQNNCHYIGRCVDIGLTSAKTCANFITLMADFRAAGLNVFNETGCKDTHTTKFGSGPHIHVSE